MPEDNIRSFTLPSKAGWVGDASVVFADARWAKAIGRILFTKAEPPQDDVLVSNATGNTDVDKTIIPALRGGGWNVPTFVDQPMRPASMTTGDSVAARALSRTFGTPLRAGADRTTLLIGTDLLPHTE